ncbi:MAG: hypothetical protein AAGH99_09395 [Planctomycetota bacterium]
MLEKQSIVLVSIMLIAGCCMNNEQANINHTQPETIYVFGTFDLDKDGKPDPNGYELITDIAERLGHNTADELNDSVTLAVIGDEPDIPTQPSDEQAPILMKEYRSALDSYQAYQSSLRTTADLGIPVINQTRFLNQAGYFTE